MAGSRLKWSVADHYPTGWPEMRPDHFKQAVRLVTEQHVPGDTIPVGPDQEGFLRFHRDRVLPQLQ